MSQTKAEPIVVQQNENLHVEMSLIAAAMSGAYPITTWWHSIPFD
jgi:hypothetical protein